MNGRNIILMAVLAAQVALAVIALKPADRGGVALKNFLAGVAPAGISEVAINDEKTGVVLRKEGDAWQVKAGDETYPADPAKVEGLLAKLVALHSDRPVTRTKTSHSRLKVADDVFQRRLKVTAAGKEIALYFGASSSYKAQHLRAGGEDEVYIVKDFSVWDLQANRESWWQTRLIDLSATEITALSLANAKGSFRLVKSDAGWRLDGGDTVLDDAMVGAFLDQAGHVSALQYVGREAKPDYGLEKPEATLTVEAGDRRFTLQVGRKNKDADSHVVRAGHIPFFATVASHVAEPLLTQTGAMFPAKADEAVKAEAGGEAAVQDVAADKNEDSAKEEPAAK